MDEPSLLWFEKHIASIHSCNSDANYLFYRTLLLVMNNGASIWERQMLSSNDRIRDLAAIEMSSYHRLVKAMKASSQWERRQNEVSTFDDDVRTKAIHHETLQCHVEANQIVQDILNDTDATMLTTISDDHGTFDDEVRCWPLYTAVILADKVPLLDRCVRSKLHPPWNEQCASTFAYLLLALVTAKRQVELWRKCDEFEPMDTLFFTNLLQDLAPRISNLDASQQFPVLCTVLKCSVILADGRSSLYIVNLLLKAMVERPNTSHPESDWPNIQLTLQAIRRHSSAPVVRVINLERRKDRMRSFMVQALHERLLVVKAVTEISMISAATCDQTFNCNGYEFGGSAVDGRGRLVEATARLVQTFGSMEIVNKFVESHWRPNDLKPFDVDAPNNDALMVRISPSERACALSHILSWKGVLRSLQSATIDSSLETHMLRLYKISGYAQGPALLKQNRDMPPTPVCIILEDDAILVDRFTDRLDEMLLELPRDFHFCSLGYSRPKSAPIVPYSDHIGIPSMLWYLTGYCLSAAGAQYLLDALPVVGPVDSWIGLKMTNNWDNTFGTRLGVGIHAKPQSEMPSNHDYLGQIMKFHAYCARRPLCSQKVRVTTTALTSGTIVAPTEHGRRQWRQRDTDIEYSGGQTV